MRRALAAVPSSDLLLFAHGITQILVGDAVTGAHKTGRRT